MMYYRALHNALQQNYITKVARGLHMRDNPQCGERLLKNNTQRAGTGIYRVVCYVL